MGIFRNDEDGPQGDSPHPEAHSPLRGMAEEHFDLAIVGGGVLGDRAAGRAGSEGAGAFSLGVTGFGRAMTPVEDVLVSPGAFLAARFLATDPYVLRIGRGPSR